MPPAEVNLLEGWHISGQRQHRLLQGSIRCVLIPPFRRPTRRDKQLADILEWVLLLHLMSSIHSEGLLVRDLQGHEAVVRLGVAGEDTLIRLREG